jgi:hypothetical protein
MPMASGISQLDSASTDGIDPFSASAAARMSTFERNSVLATSPTPASSLSSIRTLRSTRELKVEIPQPELGPMQRLDPPNRRQHAGPHDATSLSHDTSGDHSGGHEFINEFAASVSLTPADEEAARMFHAGVVSGSADPLLGAPMSSSSGSAAMQPGADGTSDGLVDAGGDFGRFLGHDFSDLLFDADELGRLESFPGIVPSGSRRSSVDMIGALSGLSHGSSVSEGDAGAHSVASSVPPTRSRALGADASHGAAVNAAPEFLEMMQLLHPIVVQMLAAQKQGPRVVLRHMSLHYEDSQDVIIRSRTCLLRVDNHGAPASWPVMGIRQVRVLLVRVLIVSVESPVDG